MKANTPTNHARVGTAMATLALWIVCVVAVHAQDGATLRARHEGLRAQLADNQFQRPLHLESVQNTDELKGEVFAVVVHPFAVVATALQGADHWCDLLILHLNVKECSTSCVRR